MPELKDEKERCHFCISIAEKKFEYDVHRLTDKSCKRNVPACDIHFTELCDTVYSTLNHYYNHLPVGQREYVAIKRLESQLDVINTIQFK